MTGADRENGFVGPHEGRELAMMLDGTKPLSMFADVSGSDVEIFDEETFDRYASRGEFIKRTHVERCRDFDLELVLYALPEEAWRIDAMILVQSVYACGPSGWRPDLERVIGRLLGYAAQDIERFIDRIPECQRASSGAEKASDPVKPTTWDGFLETLEGLELPPDFLDPEDRKRHQGNRRDPFEDWTE